MNLGTRFCLQLPMSCFRFVSLLADFLILETDYDVAMGNWPPDDQFGTPCSVNVDAGGGTLVCPFIIVSRRSDKIYTHKKV